MQYIISALCQGSRRVTELFPTPGQTEQEYLAKRQFVKWTSEPKTIGRACFPQARSWRSFRLNWVLFWPVKQRLMPNLPPRQARWSRSRFASEIPSNIQLPIEPAEGVISECCVLLPNLWQGSLSLGFCQTPYRASRMESLLLVKTVGAGVRATARNCFVAMD